MGMSKITGKNQLGMVGTGECIQDLYLKVQQIFYDVTSALCVFYKINYVTG